MNRKPLFGLFGLLVIAGIALFASCAPGRISPAPEPNLPNPASGNCEQNGGKLEMREDSSGGIAGVCVFSDGSECDEWAYFRGECKPGDSLEIADENKASPPSGSPDPDETASTPESQARIEFYSNRGDGYDHIYLMEIGSGILTPLTQEQSNTFSGPFSPAGTHILFTGFGLTHSYIGMMNPDGSGQVELTNLPESDQAFPAWSPDGSKIAFTSRRDGNNEIYVMNADGSDPRRLTNNPKDDFAPSWSPDGSQLVFVSDRENPTGIYSLYLMNADGTGVVRLTKGGSSDSSPDWSPDGTNIAYQSIRVGQADLFIIHADGSGERNLTQNPADDYAPRWSPDGDWIAFQTNRDGNWEIYLIDLDGTNLTNLTNDPSDDQSPYWGP